MNRQTTLLLVALTGLVLFIAVSATEPNDYLSRQGSEAAPQPYPWQYPVWLVVFGIVTIGSMNLSKTFARLIGVLISFVFSACLVVLLAMTVMHSPPVHINLLYVFFLSSLGLLFYLGYTFAVWRQEGGDTETSS
ncbi:MAG: hypothetical protein QNJ19_03040 [Woeseiaceae bacterium]|nr:hypothetical protein [Woeseiaceae bacterium]